MVRCAEVHIAQFGMWDLSNGRVKIKGELQASDFIYKMVNSIKRVIKKIGWSQECNQCLSSMFPKISKKRS